MVERFDVGRVALEAADVLRAALAARTPAVLAHPDGLVVTEEPDGLVVVDEVSLTAHHLNELAAAVFLLVEEGPATAEQLVAAFAEVVDRPAEEVAEPVTAAVSALVGGGLLVAHHGRQPD
jgi:hypothetical protein